MKNIALCLSSILFAFVLAEITLRIFPNLSPQIDILNGKPIVKHTFFLYPDKDVGQILQPNLKAKIHRSTYEGKGYYPMNIGPDGFRQSTQRDSAIRVAVVGDSFVFGDGVGDQDTISEVLGNLSGNEVKNFGVPGANIAMEAATIEKYVLPWKPTQIIWCFFEGNDFYLNDQFIGWKKTAPQETFFFNVITGGSKKMAHLRNIQTFLAHHILILALLKPFYINGFSGEKDYLKNNSYPIQTTSGLFEMLFAYGLESLKSGAPANMDQQEWEIISRNFDGIVSKIQASKIPLTIVLFPIKEHIYIPLSHHPLAPSFNPADYMGPNEIFQKLLKNKTSIKFLDVTTHFWEMAPHNRPLYFKVDAHFNEKGNEEVAKFLFQKIDFQKRSDSTAKE